MNREEYMQRFEQDARKYLDAYRAYDGSAEALESLVVSVKDLLRHLRLNFDSDSLGIEFRMDDDENAAIDISAELQSLHLPDGDSPNIFRSED